MMIVVGGTRTLLKAKLLEAVFFCLLHLWRWATFPQGH